jgi:hypothetical protein
VHSEIEIDRLDIFLAPATTGTPLVDQKERL